ncbi:MAG: hypothetical protein KBD56_00485 [Candidatus Eisenbacteria bacterium]|nr:hypothetical protein [Candidatus Eisenbacteria bacterium]
MATAVLGRFGCPAAALFFIAASVVDPASPEGSGAWPRTAYPRPAVQPFDGVEDVVVFALGNRLARVVHGRVLGDHRCEADFDVSFHATGQGFDFSSESIVEMEG